MPEVAVLDAQTPASAPEQAPESAPAAETQTETPQAPAEPKAPAAPQGFDLDTGDLDALLAHPRIAGRVKTERDNAANTAAQRAISEARRTAGQKDHVRARALEVFQEAGGDPSALTERQLRTFDFIDDLNRENLRPEIAKEIWAVFAPTIRGDAQISAETAALLEQGDHEGYIKAVQEAGYQHHLGHKTKMKDIPEGSPLHKEMQGEIRRQVRAELAAKEQEGKTVVAPPGSPSGSGSSGAFTADDLEKIPNSEWVRKPPEERQRLLAAARASAYGRAG